MTFTMPCRAGARLLAATLLYGAALASSWAQIPGLPSFTGQKDSPPSASSTPLSSESKSRLDRLIEDFRADRERALPRPPEGITDAELARERDVLLTLTHLNDRRSYAEGELARLKQARAAAEVADQSWPGIATPPPYSILAIDEWRDDADMVRVHIASLQAAIQHLDSEFDRAQSEVKRAEESWRRASDARDPSSDDVGRERERWRRDLAELQVRTAGASALLTRLAREAKAEDLAARQADLHRLDRQIVTARQHVRFDASDLAQAQRRLKEFSAQIEQDRVRLGRQLQERQRQRDNAAGMLEKAAPGTPERATAQARLAVAQAWADTLRYESEIASGLPRLVDAMAQMWDQRSLMFNSSDAEVRRVAQQRVQASIETLSPWRVYVDILVNEARAQLRAAESRLTQADFSAGGGTAPEVDAVTAARYTVGAYERVQTTIDEADRTLRRWVADSIEKERSGDWRARAMNAWLSVKDLARTVWEFELFAVEDSTVIDGKQVTIPRGVTVGKSVGALLLFVLGYWIIGRLAGHVERRMVRRGLNAERVRTFRRWTVAVMAFALVLLTLNLARIPLSVFAFLGGALAIGVGFGTQTIIKNFISGMILLVERRVQIGDVIEIDGVQGTVTAVDLRSSTVRSGDGRETLVPNSVLLEHKVANWTLTDRKVQRSIRVGVAHGTPMRVAAEKIEDTAKRHGNVLSSPPPQVLFEEFADSAQILALYFWVEISDKVSASQVASDLRFMLDKRFADEGIAIAFPQRDVRVDPTRPIRVEMIAPSTEGAPKVVATAPPQPLKKIEGKPAP